MLLRLITAMVALLVVVTPLAVASSHETDRSGADSVVDIGSGGAPNERPAIEQPQHDIEQLGESTPGKSLAVPSSMAALGDSITRGFNACGFYFDCVARSWSTGDSAEVGSHYLGLRQLNPAIHGKNFNDAKSGAVAADMAGQAQQAVKQQVEYVTLLVGANDACRPTKEQMTSVQTYSGQIKTALDAVKSGLPKAKVFIASIPDVKRVWETSRGNTAARTAWRVGNICQSMLANPTSDAPADNQRRDQVRQRIVDYNSALEKLCGEYGAKCKFDGNAVFNQRFSAQMLSNFDFFHPNQKGQAELARITRTAGFQWSRSPDSVLL